MTIIRHGLLILLFIALTWPLVRLGLVALGASDTVRIILAAAYGYVVASAGFPILDWLEDVRRQGKAS